MISANYNCLYSLDYPDSSYPSYPSFPHEYRFGYKEMLVPNPSEWELEPLDQYGVWLEEQNKKELVINADTKALVRTRDRHTDWRAVKMQMMAGESK